MFMIEHAPLHLTRSTRRSSQELAKGRETPELTSAWGNSLTTRQYTGRVDFFLATLLVCSAPIPPPDPALCPPQGARPTPGTPGTTGARRLECTAPPPGGCGSAAPPPPQAPALPSRARPAEGAPAGATPPKP
eukprot:988788-Prorocentrum_minimum.AAC.1